jgi:hypothetical protein
MVDMYSEKCVVENKSGIEELDHRGPYAVITNRRLYDHGKAHRYALINIREAWIDSVYRDVTEAREEMRGLSRGS